MHQSSATNDMGGLTQLFLRILETLTHVANALVHTLLPVPRPFGSAPKTPPPPCTLESLTNIYFYTDDMIKAVQGGPDRQRQFFDGPVPSLKWLFPSLPRETKDSVSAKKLKVGEGD